MMMRRIKRDYRRLSPSGFLAFCLKVKHSLTNNPNYVDSIFSGQLAQFFELVTRLEPAYRAASNGDRLLIRDRDKLIDETALLLDTIASLLEAASMGQPDALYTTGFSITQERRSHTRTKLPLSSPLDFNVVNSGEPRKAIANASSMPGVYNSEIHVNRNDPSSESDWFHKALYPDAKTMVLDNLEPGNTFFRMRFHGPDGPGPWSPVTSVTIS